MRAAGVDRFGAGIRLLELPEPPPAERGIALSDIVVVPDGARLARLVPLLAPDAITVGASYPLAGAAAAMARLLQGTHGAAVVLEP